MNTENGKLSLEDEASDAFMQPLQGQWTRADQERLEARLSTDPAYAKVYGKVGKIWDALDACAGSPELMRYREEAIAYARQVSGRRWSKTNRHRFPRWYAGAAAAGVAFVLVTAWLFYSYGYRPGEYRTDIGEQRAVELDDQSRISMDAATRLRVRYSTDTRLIELKEGQAQFSVAQDPTRPFKVIAGDQTIVALGTVFTVEYVDRKVHVAMLEGKVAVVPATPRPVAEQREDGGTSRDEAPGTKPLDLVLSAGEELRVAQDGRTSVTHDADLEAATAWQDGKVIFRAEPLAEAVRRVNRYSRVKIEVLDPALASEPINGVFEAGNAQRFVDALQRSFPVAAESLDSDTIRLRPR